MNEREIKEYLTSLKVEKGLASNTITSYQGNISSFFACINKSYSKIKENDIYDYMHQLVSKGLDSTSISHKITALKMFYKYLLKEGLVKENIFEKINRPKKQVKLPDYLTIEQIDKLFSFKLETSFDYRNKAMLELLYATGMRVSELINVKISDINFYEDYIVVIGKGNKQRIIPLTDIAIKCIKDYVDNYYPKFNKNKKCEFLFLNKNGLKLTRQGFDKVLKDIALKQGLEKVVYPHIIRHSFATHLLNNGASLMVIKELLGHENVSTTGIYTHLSINELKDNYDMYHPHK